MLTLSQLKLDLESKGLTPDNVRHLSCCCREMFFSDSTLASHLAWSLFRTLSDLWDDGQGVPTLEIQPYIDKLLPALRKWASSKESFSDIAQMETVLRVFRECHSEVSETE